VDYKYLNDPFPDEEEANIAYIGKEEALAVLAEDDCRDLRQARNSPEWPEWEQAIQSELDQLEHMGTWRLVDKPHDAIPISNKFVFTKKRDNKGNIIKYKARLVAKGYAQRPGFDYVDTHSPVVRMETIRAILAIAPTCKLHIHQLDIKGAYLNGTLKEKIFMKQPEGYGDGSNRVCLLIKTLYGLKQAGREWNLEMDRKMRGKGYVRIRSDACVYIWRTDDDFVIIAIWVDDMLLFATTVELERKAISDVSNEWEITDLGVPTRIVGIELAISPDAISISSSSYINTILAREKMDTCNSVSTPLDPKVVLVPNPEANEINRSNDFARLLGELQYISNATRPDITYAVNRLASYTGNPSLQHYTALKRVLRYLNGTKSYRITYKAKSESDDNFVGFADAAYANADESRSTIGYVFLAGDAAITWSSKKLSLTSLSSTQAEYVALSEAAREACWLRNLYTELGLLNEEQPTVIVGDNEGAIALTQNPQFHKRTKHIEVRWHWIRELVQEGTIAIESRRDPEQTADILTKALHREKHLKHTREMGLAPV
jgi:hypothetical protein